MRFKKIGWCLALLSRLCCFCLFLVPAFAVFGVKDVFFCQMETSKNTLNISKAGKKQREDVKFVWKHWQLLFWGVCCRKLSSVFAVAPKCPRVNTQKIEANDCSVALLSIPKNSKNCNRTFESSALPCCTLAQVWETLPQDGKWVG